MAVKKRSVELYEHADKKRANNPPVGLANSESAPPAPKASYAYDPHLDPALQSDPQGMVERLLEQALAADSLEDARTALKELKQLRRPRLNFANREERTSFEVPTVSLHVHERVDPKTILDAVQRSHEDSSPGQLAFFAQPGTVLPLREALDFYHHAHEWSNRLIAGDSLLIMNSLLKKEAMGGKVQCVYIDPPYGIKYGGNFQPFVNKRQVQDDKDEDLTAEPEMIRAFRDTWELGIHSYLGYLRDRLLLASELLSDSGSCFVQISEKNLHLVRCLMDEVFGAENFQSLICFATTSGFPGEGLSRRGDYLVWYAKDKTRVKYRQLFLEKAGLERGDAIYKNLELPDGARRPMTPEERQGKAPLSPRSRIFRYDNVQSQGAARKDCPIKFAGRIFRPNPNSHWKAHYPEGMERLNKEGRLAVKGDRLQYVRYLDDNPVQELTNAWMDTGFAGFVSDKRYVVETNAKVVQRCLLMTTDPGDLVLDPTCGSGTTAYVAEQWGRRWITCDTSRVAIALARQRLMTSCFDYYRLAYPKQGVGSGFVYEEVPHIKLENIANGEPSAKELLYDQPECDKNKVRVSGPFTVEAVPAPVVQSLDEVEEGTAAGEVAVAVDASVARSGASLRHVSWRDKLLKDGICAKGGRKIHFSRIESHPVTQWVHAVGETKADEAPAATSAGQASAASFPQNPQSVVLSFGPEHAPLESRQVEAAWQEAHKLAPRPDLLIFLAFQFDPEAAKNIDEFPTGKNGVTCLRVQMNPDLLTEDLKKKKVGDQCFWLVGRPDVEVVCEGSDKEEKSLEYRVRVHGFDYYNTKTSELEFGGSNQIAVWMLDPDYDGRSIYPRQVFFPMAGEKEGWGKLAKNLRAEIDTTLIEQYRGCESLPFKSGQHRRIAVKIVDNRGIESLRIIQL